MNCKLFSPTSILTIFTLVNIWTYFDRGALATCLDTIQDTYKLSNTQGGVLGGAYMAGYVIASPIFAHYAHHYRPLRMMAFGLLFWCLATLFSGLSLEFYTLLFARMFTGVGEASFLCLSPPFIDKFAPPGKKAQWLSIFFSGIPVGYAIGAAFSGSIIDAAIFGSFTWRSIFILEAIIMLVFVLICLSSPPDILSFKEDQESSLNNDATQTLLVQAEAENSVPMQANGSSAVNNQKPQIKDELMVLARNPVYLALVFAYAAQTFVTGGFAYYGVQYVEKRLGFSKSAAGSTFGAITAATGLIGTGFGGWVMDYMKRGAENIPNIQRLELGTKLVLIFAAVALPAAILAFLAVSVGSWLVLILMAVAEFSIFSCISPINVALMASVPFKYTPIAMAMSVVGTHVLGDATSPIIIGVFLDATHDNWTLSMLIASSWLIWSFIAFFGAWIYIKRNREAVAALNPDEPNLTGRPHADTMPEYVNEFPAPVTFDETS